MLENQTTTTKPESSIPAGMSALGSALMVGGALAVCAILFWFDPVQHSFYPQCLFHKYTGWNCPGCGSLRAAHALLHGHLLAALRDNVLFVSALPFAGFFFVRHTAAWAVGRPLPLPQIRPGIILIFVAGLVVFTVVRNLPVAPFTLLSPQ